MNKVEKISVLVFWIVLSQSLAKAQVTLEPVAKELGIESCESMVAIPTIFHIHTVPINNSGKKNILGLDFDHVFSVDTDTVCNMVEQYGKKRREEVAIFFSDHGQKIAYGSWLLLSDNSKLGESKYRSVIPIVGYEYTKGSIFDEVVHHLGVYDCSIAITPARQIEIIDSVESATDFPTQRKSSLLGKIFERYNDVPKYFIAPNLQSALNRFYNTRAVLDICLAFNHPWLSRDSFYDFDFSNILSGEKIWKLLFLKFRLIEIAGGEAGEMRASFNPGLKYYTRCLQRGWRVAPIVGEDNMSINKRRIKDMYERLQTYIWVDNQNSLFAKDRIVTSKWSRYRGVKSGVMDRRISVSSVRNTRMFFELNVLKPVRWQMQSAVKGKYLDFDLMMGDRSFWKIYNGSKISTTIAVYNPRRNSLVNLVLIYVSPDYAKAQFLRTKHPSCYFRKSKYLQTFLPSDTSRVETVTYKRIGDFDVYSAYGLENSIQLNKVIAIYTIGQFYTGQTVSAPIFINGPYSVS